MYIEISEKVIGEVLITVSFISILFIGYKILNEL